MNRSAIIQPRTLKGFRDFLPEMMMPREQIIDTARRVYRSYGFAPIDTPALEYLEVLAGKGSAECDKQLYQFEDSGGRHVGMRFDLTVPLARFAAQHIGELGTPFKRYHIATVWRGENTQRGRYREFMQCDFDTIGTRSLVADVETVLVIHDLLRAIGMQRFTICINHRQVLTGLLEQLGVSDQATAILRALDKLPKLGREKVAAEMGETAGTTRDQSDRILALAAIRGDTGEVLAQLTPLMEASPLGQEGVSRLADIVAAVQSAGLPDTQIKLDVSIARGLDYYTGLVVETFLDDLPSIGSICSGGRYDNLAELYTRQELPGIGASLGLDRLLAAMEELEMINPSRTPAQVLVALFDPARLHDYLQIARWLRAGGIGVEIFPDAKRLGPQLKYADRRGFQFALIAGEDEFAAGHCQLKDLASGESKTLSLADQGIEVVRAVQHRLGDAHGQSR